MTVIVSICLFGRLMWFIINDMIFHDHTVVGGFYSFEYIIGELIPLLTFTTSIYLVRRRKGKEEGSSGSYTSGKDGSSPLGSGSQHKGSSVGASISLDNLNDKQ